MSTTLKEFNLSYYYTQQVRPISSLSPHENPIYIKSHEKFLEKENKETPFVILTFLVFTFNINAVLTKNKKDHIKMSKRGQSSLAMINS